MEAVFRCEELCIGYGTKKVAAQISASVMPGEILAILGANGCGKSTFLKTAAGLLPALSGRLYLKEKELSAYSDNERAKIVSVLLPGSGHMGHMTCREMVEMGRFPYTGRLGLLGKEDAAIVDMAMEEVHVTELGDADFSGISDGQRQRVRLAAAFAQEPELLLLDEPTVFLDIRYQAEFMRLLKDQCKKKRCSAIVTLHEVGIALAVADRLLCLKDGAVYACGTGQELRQKECLPALYGVSEETMEEEFGPALSDYLKRSLV